MHYTFRGVTKDKLEEINVTIEADSEDEAEIEFWRTHYDYKFLYLDITNDEEIDALIKEIEENL